MRRFVVACALPMAWFAMACADAQAQSPEERYFADRAATIARFTPERMPDVDKPQMAEEEKARKALDRQLFAVIGKTAPKGFGAAKSNISTLFGSEIDFGKLDGLVFEADGGATQMLVTTLPLLRNWLKSKEDLPKDAERAIRDVKFLTSAVSTDAAVLHYADLPLDAPQSFAMLVARTQDRAPEEANEVFVTAIRGGRVYVANTELKQAIKVPACAKARQAADRKLDAAEKKEFKPGRDNADLVDRMSKLRDAVDADFQTCFAQNAPKEARFAAAMARARDLFERMPAR